MAQPLTRLSKAVEHVYVASFSALSTSVHGVQLGSAGEFDAYVWKPSSHERAAIGVHRCTYLAGRNRGNCAHVVAGKRYSEVGGRVNEVSLRRRHTKLLGFVGFSAAREVVRYAAGLRYARCDHRNIVSHLRAGENLDSERQTVDLGGEWRVVTLRPNASSGLKVCAPRHSSDTAVATLLVP